MTNILMSLTLLSWYLGANDVFGWSVLSLSILLLIELVRYIKNRTKNIPYLSSGFLFFIGYYLVHFQLYIWKVFGKTNISDDVYEFLFVSEDVMIRGALASVIGLFSFVKGYKFVKAKMSVSTKTNGRIQNSVLLLPTITAFVVFFFSNSDYLSGTYNLLSWSPLTKYSYALFITLYYAGLSYRLYTLQTRSFAGFLDYLRSIGLGWTILTVVYTFFSMFIGDRGPIISNTLLFMSLYLFRLQKVSWLKSSLILAMSIILLVGVKSLRTRNHKSFENRFSNFSVSSNEGEKLGLEANVLTMPLELGLSARCLHHAIDYTDQNGFFNGYFQVRQLVSSIPFAGSLFGFVVNGNKEPLISSSSLLSHKIQGGDVRYGDGTTAVADLYLDFGFGGVIIGLFCFGIAMSRLDRVLTNSSKQMSYWLYVLAITYFSTSFYLGRSTLMIMLQRAVPVILLIYTVMIFFRKTSNSHENVG